MPKVVSTGGELKKEDDLAPASVGYNSRLKKDGHLGIHFVRYDRKVPHYGTSKLHTFDHCTVNCHNDVHYLWLSLRSGMTCYTL